MQVRLLRNTAELGGAIDTSGSNTLTIKGGNNVMQNNIARFGGAFYIDPLTMLLIESRLCASGNRASVQSGFAFVPGQLVFDANSEVLLLDNTPDAVLLFPSRVGAVRCGVGAPSWASSQGSNPPYNVTGPACACNTMFVDGTSTTCESAFRDCGASTWDQGTCACVRAVWLAIWV